MSPDAKKETAQEDLAALSAEVDLLGKIPIGYARKHLLLPCRGSDGSLVVLSGRPEATHAQDEIRFLVGPVRFFSAPPDVIPAKNARAHRAPLCDLRLGGGVPPAARCDVCNGAADGGGAVRQRRGTG